MDKSTVDQKAKLAGYSAAAMMGAFGVSQSAEGAVIYTDIADQTASAGNDVEINFDGDSYRDVLFRIINGRVRAYGDTGNILTDTDDGTKNTYYIRGFELGEPLSATTPVETGPNILAEGDFAGDAKFLGVVFSFSGQTHYGWVGVEVTNSTGIIRDYAYESTPDTAIAAGAVPEPSSLALLAMGAGAMALRPRRDREVA